MSEENVKILQLSEQIDFLNLKNAQNKQIISNLIDENTTLSCKINMVNNKIDKLLSEAAEKKTGPAVEPSKNQEPVKEEKLEVVEDSEGSLKPSIDETSEPVVSNNATSVSL